MADTIKTNLGPVTAYADAKAHGYTGTREEFGQLLAGAAGNLQDAVAAKEGAEAAKQSAETAQKAAAENQKNAGTHAENAKASADTAAEQANAAKESAAGAANSATASQESETNAGLSATAAANAEAAAKQAQNSAETAKTDAEAAQTAAGNSADAAANSAADAKKTLESIPADYSALSGKVDENSNGIRELKEDLGHLSESKISKFYASNQGETHLSDSDNGKIVDMMLYGKSSQDGTPTPTNPIEIKSVVNPTVNALNEDGTESQAVTIPYTLNAIPVSSGGNVTIAGQQYIADYVDVEKGKLYRKVKRLDLKDIDNTAISHGFHSNGNGYLSITIENAVKNGQCISNKYEFATWTQNSGYLYIPNNYTVIIVDDRFTDKQTAIGLTQDVCLIYELASPIEDGLSPEQIKSLKSLSTYHPVTNITVGSEELDGYAVFNYPVSMANGWNYVKQQLNDNRDYIYNMDTQSAEAYVNSEYAVALTELEV